LALEAAWEDSGRQRANEGALAQPATAGELQVRAGYESLTMAIAIDASTQITITTCM